MNRLVISLIAVICFCNVSHGQYRLGNDIYNYFSIGGGIGYYQSKDYLLTTTRFDGIGGNFLLTYSIDRPRTFQLAKFQFETGAERNRAGFNGIFLFYHLSYSFLYQLAQASPVYAGVKAYGGTDEHFYYGLDDGHLYWLTSYNLQPHLMYAKRLKHQKALTLDASLVIAGFVSRPPAESFVSNFKNNALWKDVNTNFQLAFPDRLLRVHAGAQYQFDVAHGLRYEFEYYQYPDPEQVTFLSHTITYTKRLGTKNSF